MQILNLVSDSEMEFHLEYYRPSPRSSAKVGTVEIKSRCLEINRRVSEVLGIWLAENGWAGFVRIETEVDREHATIYGFEAAKVTFIPGEFQSNELRTFHAEISFDLDDLRDELRCWLTELGAEPTGAGEATLAATPAS